MSQKIKKIKGLLIDPEKEVVTEIEIHRVDGVLKDLNKIIGCTYLDCIPYGIVLPNVGEKSDIIFVDDEGMLQDGQKHFWALPMYRHVIAGRGVVLGIDEDEVSISHTLTSSEVELLKSVIQFYHEANTETRA